MENIKRFVLGDMVRVCNNRTQRYGEQPIIGTIGTITRVDISGEYVCLDVAPGGVYIDELEPHNNEWDI